MLPRRQGALDGAPDGRAWPRPGSGAGLRPAGVPLHALHAQRVRGGSADLPAPDAGAGRRPGVRSEEHTSELQSLMRISYAVFCLKKKTTYITITNKPTHKY